MEKERPAQHADVPTPVRAILDWGPTWFLARLLIVSAYLLGGLVKATDWTSAVAEQAHFGMKPPEMWAAVTIMVEIIAPLLILAGRLVWLGAGMLGVFTLMAAFTANAFWGMPVGQERFMATNAFFEHLGLVGAFVLIALVARFRDGRA